ncbi:unnamed protein product [Blepharisma stoltei]|uniref:Uncharacterized protein n=1 Tax=Blepharisma stoltei TaxID=1481888 RepID=A0AAU9KC98_9CILI|nr:unnamed protein product [Blepharisma stoltei]
MPSIVKWKKGKMKKSYHSIPKETFSLQPTSNQAFSWRLDNSWIKTWIASLSRSQIAMKLYHPTWQGWLKTWKRKF